MVMGWDGDRVFYKSLFFQFNEKRKEKTEFF